MSINEQNDHAMEQGVEMPKPTAAPIVIAFGVMLLACGLVLNMIFAAVGAVVFVVGMTRWIHILVSGTGEELMPIAPGPQPVKISKVQVEPLRPGMPGHRMKIPEHMHPYSAGIKGGIIGGCAMAVTALLYGIIYRSIWYPINLLGAMVLTSVGDLPTGEIESYLLGFHFWELILGFVIFAATSIGVGLMFGILLPTLPRWPVFWGGIVAPLLWTGAIYSFMGVLNPVMNNHVDWEWFFASQFAYGITVGLVVIRTEKIPVGGIR